MTDFLLELRSEEIPARMQDRARADLEKLFAAELGKAGLKAAAITTYATPRRLALIAWGLPLATEAVSEEVKGPRTSAPEQALDGFLRKTGLTREQLTDRDGTWFAVTQKPGRATAEVLAEAIPAIIRAFPWPKSMRWGAASLSTESLRWVRPLQGIVALLGDTVVPCEIAGVVSGAQTLGHRFHAPGAVTIAGAAGYVEQLRAAWVLVDQDERRAIIRERAGALAAEAGLELIADEGLVAENAGLTEWPVPLLGRFDEAYLSVPPEVIQLTARVNQKYFVCQHPAIEELGERDDGRLAPARLANAFICTANIAADDGGAAIVEGNRKVLAARLSDARFFYETDLKVPLAVQAEKLSKIVFHEKLGTVADKVERVAKLARWLVEEGIVSSSPSLLGEGGHAQHGGGARSEAEGAVAYPSTTGFAGGPPPQGKLGEDRATLADMAERAARLAKADLVTGMVGEFPELQGVMGGYYAAAQGEPVEVAEAIRDHYKPVGQGDDVPTAPVTVAVSLADKLDTLAGFFLIHENPTGSKDPFALRRAAIAIIRSIIGNLLRVEIKRVVIVAVRNYILQTQRDMHLDDSLPDAFRIGQQGVDAEVALDSFSRMLELMKETLISTGIATTLRLKPRTREAMKELANRLRRIEPTLVEVQDFFADRLKVQQREAGVRHDLIDAVFALGGEDDLVRLLARVHALQAFMATEDGANLLAGYKRAANILKTDGGVADAADTSAAGPLPYTPEPAEAALIDALAAAEPLAAAAIEAERFEDAMAALATLRAPIDRFFDDVTVNDSDPAKRAARRALLARLRDAVHRVADFSKIEG